MYKVLFADDEILTREAITENTPWEETGFTLMGTAQNGKEAIELMEMGKPDLLITDICMPIMDGIELSEFVKKNYPDTQVMILSGYDEFEYAKQALKNGVAEYILKPITSFELKEELLKFKEKIDKAYDQKYHVEKIQKAYEKNMPVVREHFLNRLLEGNIAKEQIEERLEYFGIKLEGAYQAVAFVEIEDVTEIMRSYPGMPENLMQFAIANIANEILINQKKAITFQNVNDTCVVIYAEESEEKLQNLIRETGDSIREAMVRCMKTQVYIAVGETVHTPAKWKKSYESAKHAEEFKYLIEDPSYIFEKDFCTNSNIKTEQSAFEINEWVEKLVLYMKANQSEKLEKAIQDFFAEIYHAKYERQTACLQIQNCVLSIAIKLEEIGLELPNHAERETSFINYLHTYKRLSQIKERFQIFCMDLTSVIASKKENSNQTMAELAIDYMNKNYSNPDLSLNAVCEYLSVSVSYFSMIFKNYTKETFIEMLTKVRMEKAKKMLETTRMKNYEVAAAVGYNDPHYFGATFKKYTGMTPTEYLKKTN